MNTDERMINLERRVESLSGSLYALKIAMVIVLSGEASSMLLNSRKERLLAELLNSQAPDAAIDSMADNFDLLIAALATGGK